jgi:hypothetical protein
MESIMRLSTNTLKSAWFKVERLRCDIAIHGITPSTTIDEMKAIAKKLANSEAKTGSKPNINKKLYYVENLIEISALTVSEHLIKAYIEEFERIASEAELESISNLGVEIHDKKIFHDEAAKLEKVVCEKIESYYDKKKENEIQIKDLFVPGKIIRIQDKTYPYRWDERSSNGARLLSLLKAKTNEVVNKETGDNNRNFYDMSSTIENVYEYKGMILTVKASSPRSGKHTNYEFTCSVL